MLSVHRDLRRHVWGVAALCGASGVVGALAVIAAAGNLGRLLGEAWTRPTGRWVLVSFGLLMLGLAWLGVSLAPRWYARSTWVLDHVGPVGVRLRLLREDSGDSSAWYAELAGPGRAEPGAAPERYAVLPPRWDAAAVAGRLVPAEAFVDPGSGWPRVFRTVQGLLWVMPGGRRRPGAAG